MPTFFGREYRRPVAAIGRTERALGLLILLMTVAIVAAFAYTAGRKQPTLSSIDEQVAGSPEPSSSRATRFPDGGLAGWRGPLDQKHFGPDELYVKIDGRAEAYLANGCRRLSFARYEHERDASRAIEVCWYEMETADGARAMYESERPPDAAPVAVGQSGYQVGGSVFFHQADCYVQVLTAGTEAADADVALRIAELLAGRP